MTNPSPAQALYAQRYTETLDLLERIARQLEAHRGSQAQQPRDWGYAADLARQNEKLAYLLAELGDRSAVDAKGLDF